MFPLRIKSKMEVSYACIDEIFSDWFIIPALWYHVTTTIQIYMFKICFVGRKFKILEVEVSENAEKVKIIFDMR